MTASLYHVGSNIEDAIVCPDCGWGVIDGCSDCAADHADWHRECDLSPLGDI